MSNRLTALVAAAWLLAAAAPAPAQQAPAGVRLVEVRTAPDSIHPGVPFELRVTIRAPAGLRLLMPDTLLPAETVQSAGRGEWSVAAGPADSVDVRARYPVIGFQAGTIALPALPLAIAAATDGAEAPTTVQRAGGAGGGSLALPLGEARIGDYAAVLAADSLRAPRPPADVLGRDWSAWLFVLLGTVAVAGVGAAGARTAGLWRRLFAPLIRRSEGQSARREALLELERVRGLGWHRGDRVDEFYAATTGALRRFANHFDSGWVAALTSAELLARIEARWGADRATPLAEVVQRAERVKFGRLRPDGDTAEADWAVVRDWVRSVADR